VTWEFCYIRAAQTRNYYAATVASWGAQLGGTETSHDNSNYLLRILRLAYSGPSSSGSEFKYPAERILAAVSRSTEELA
jgi:hypothetical protein